MGPATVAILGTVGLDAVLQGDAGQRAAVVDQHPGELVQGLATVARQHPCIRVAQARDVGEPQGITQRPQLFVEPGCGVRGVEPGVVGPDHVHQQEPARRSDEMPVLVGLAGQGGPLLPGRVRA